MADNWTDDEIKTVAEEQVAERKKIGIPKFVNIRDLAREKLQSNPNDADADAALQILQKGLQAFLQEHGANPPREPGVLGDGNDDNNVAYGPDVKLHRGRALVPVYKDGRNTHDYMDEEDAKASRYRPVFDQANPNTILGYYNPAENANTVNAQDPNEMIPLLDGNNQKIGETKLSDGQAQSGDNGTLNALKVGDKVVAFMPRQAPSTQKRRRRLNEWVPKNH